MGLENPPLARRGDIRVKVAASTETTHNPSEEPCWVSCLRENFTSSSDGEELETGPAARSGTAPVPYPTTVFQMDKAASSDQAVLRHVGQRGEDVNMDRGFRLRPGCHCQETPRPGGLALHFAPGFLGHPLRENADVPGISRKHDHFRRRWTQQPAESVRLLTGQ